MSGHDESEGEAIERFLGSTFPPTPDQEFRRRLLSQTTALLRRRRRLTRLSLIVALAGFYLAGLGTMRLLTGERLARPVEVATPVSSPAARAVPETSDVPAASRIEQDDSPVPAAVLEQWATIAAPEYRRDMYRRAGDRYLEFNRDVESALRCYARSLEYSSEADLATSVEKDNWLLMALKQSRQKETKDENNGG